MLTSNLIKFIAVGLLLLVGITFTLDPLPTIDGQYYFDEAHLRKITGDQANWVQNPPLLSVQVLNECDVSKVIKWCHTNRIDCVVRGNGHATMGESQAPVRKYSMVIEMRNLTAVLATTDNSVVVQAGATYRELIDAIALNCSPYPSCSRYPTARPLFVAMSIGGNLILGGMGESQYWNGYVADHVQALKIVNGQGTIINTSPTKRTDYFKAMLGGLGQAGAILEVNFTTEPAPAEMVRFYSLSYGVNYVAAFAVMISPYTLSTFQGAATVVLTTVNGTAVTFLYTVQLSKFWTGTPPNDAALLANYSYNSYTFVDFTYYNWSVRNSVGLPNTAYMGNLNSVIPLSNFSAWWLDGISRLSNAGGQFQTFFLQLMVVNTSATNVPLIKGALPSEELCIFSDGLVITNHVQRTFWAEYFETKYMQIQEIGGRLYAYGTINAVNYYSQFDDESLDFMKEMKDESDPCCILNMGRRMFTPRRCDLQPYSPLDF